MSLFPFATPFVMMLRVALHPNPPVWQVSLSIVLTSATTIGCVWAAGRIFRVGLLMQGKTPSFARMARWVLVK
jgi:ABC-type Na+ efflux pump permease subunit